MIRLRKSSHVDGSGCKKNSKQGFEEVHIKFLCVCVREREIEREVVRVFETVRWLTMYMEVPEGSGIFKLDTEATAQDI